MNKNQKTFLTLVLALSSLIWGVSYAALNTSWWQDRTYPVNEITAVSCDNQKKVYLDEDNDNDELMDKAFFMNNNIRINTAPTQSYNAVSIFRDNSIGTRILYFRPYTDMIYKLNSLGYPSTIDWSTFWRWSKVFPYQQPVRGTATNPNKIVTEKPYDNNTGKNTVWFVFWYQLLTAKWFDSGIDSTYQFHAVPDISYFFDNLAALTTIVPNTKRTWYNELRTLTGCMNFKLNRCGDGKIDTYATGQWLTTFTWETCDDGDLNGTPGHCKTDCTGLEGPAVTTGWATCTLSTTPSTIEAWQSVTINAWFTSWSNATFSPTLSSLTPPFTYPTWNGTATDSPTTTTTYTMNVDWATGLSGTSCSTTVTVTQPEPKLECTITFSPSYAWTGQVVNVWWNIANTTHFFWTYIYVNPALGWARPHRVNADQFNGVSSVMATQTGQYTFTMMVQNNTEQATCTWILNIIDNIPPCTLTTTTPTISAGQTAILQWGYTNGVLASITPSIAGMNFTYPNRSNTNIPVTPTATTTYTMNVQGVLWGSGASCSTTVRVMQTWLVLNKQLVTNIQYHPTDIVTFKINFGNNSATTLHNVVITDYLPLSLEYVDSQIFGVLPPYGFATWFMWGNASIEYSWFNLAPGQQGYVLVRGRFKGYQYADQTLNNSFATADEIAEAVYSSALFYAYNPDANITTTKTSDKTTYFPGEDARFTIAVTNNGPDAINTVTITDDRPNTTCITPDAQWTSNMPLTMTNTSDPYQWLYNGTLAVGQTIYLYITGHISNSATCVGTYINNANVSYIVNGEAKTWSAQALSFVVSTTPSSTMNFEKRLIQYGNTPWAPVVFELVYRNNWSATITNFDIVDYRPGTLNFVSASPMPTTQTSIPWGKELHRFFTTPLAPNGSGKITINWTIQ